MHSQTRQTLSPPSIEPIASLEAAREPWERLEPLTDRVFSTWEWASAWWTAYGGERELALRAVHDGERVVAVLPLYRADRRPAVLLRLLGHGAGDQLGAICGPADAVQAAEALRAVARDALPAHGLVLLERLAGDDPLLELVAGSVVRTEATPVLPRRGRTWDEWLAGRSSNFRQQIRRRESRLLREHGLRYRLSDDEDRLETDMATLFDLHRARWAEGDSTAFSPVRQAFHRDFARRALRRGWLRLWIAEAEGRPVAAWYGFRFARSEWYYQAGRDPAWDRLAIGTVLLAHSIRSAFEDGVEMYRFGLGDESYKARFTEEDPGLSSVVLGRAATRRTAAAAASAVRRIPPGLRRPFTRKIA